MIWSIIVRCILFSMSWGNKIKCKFEKKSIENTYETLWKMIMNAVQII